MARDAISRQYDVDKNKVAYTCEGDSGSYRAGSITFYPKSGKTLDLRKMEESIRATRLSGGTSMSMDYLDITALGRLKADGDKILFEVSGTPTFVLKDGDGKVGAKDALAKLRSALASGQADVTITGRVEGWKGTFPTVLRNLAQRPADAPTVLIVSEIEATKK